MSWQAGSTILGVGFAIVTMVVPMMEFAIPRLLLGLLLLLGIMLVVAWPTSLATAWLTDHKMRHVVFIAVGAIVGGLVLISSATPCCQ